MAELWGSPVRITLMGSPVDYAPSERLITKPHMGYLRDWCPTRQKYVYQHRLVMEARVGRFLESDEVVHHKNGNRSDNSIDNLELLSGGTAGHAAHHLATDSGWGWKKGVPRLYARKPEISCPVCGNPFRPKRRTTSDGKQVDTKTCSFSCGQTLRYRR